MSPADFFALSKDIRYVAIYRDGQLTSDSRPDLKNASASESDKYEELLVNPTLLKLATQRGNIDCGGLDYIVLRYGHFFEFVASIPGGHASIGMEPTADVPKLVAIILPRIRGAAAASR